MTTTILTMNDEGKHWWNPIFELGLLSRFVRYLKPLPRATAFLMDYVYVIYAYEKPSIKKNLSTFGLKTIDCSSASSLKRVRKVINNGQIELEPEPCLEDAIQ